MKYHVKRPDQIHSELNDASGRLLFSMDFSRWDTESAKIHAEAGFDFKIVADSAFGYELSLREGHLVLDKIKLNWVTGKVDITTESGRRFTLVWEGFWDSRLILFNENKEELAIIHFKPYKTTDYTIETNDKYEELNDTKLLMVIAYCFNRGFFGKWWTL